MADSTNAYINLDNYQEVSVGMGQGGLGCGWEDWGAVGRTGVPLGGLGCGWEDWGAVGRTEVPLGGLGCH